MFLPCAILTASLLVPSVWAAQGAPPSAPRRVDPGNFGNAPRQAAGTGSAGISMNFANADMYDFSSQMSSILGLSPMLIDPAVQGSVTLLMPNPIQMDDAFLLFNMILKSKNAALIRQQGVYQIVPMTVALKNNLEIIDHLPEPAARRGPSDQQVMPVQSEPSLESKVQGMPLLATHVVHVEFVPVRDLIEPVRLFMTDGGVIIPYERLNMLIFTDYTDNAARIQELIRMLDNAFLDPDLVELVKIEYNSAIDIADDLNRIFGSGAGSSGGTGPGAGSGSGNISSSGVSFLPMERLNAIFVMASTRRGLDEAKRWISDLDTDDNNKFQTFTYVVQNSTASNIAMLIQALYGGDGSGSRATTSSGGLGGGAGSLGGRSSQGTGSSSSNSRFGSSSSSSSMFDSQGYGSSSSDYGYGQGIGGSFSSNTSLGPQMNTSSRSVTSMFLPGGTGSGLVDDMRVVVDDINNSLHIHSTQVDYRYILGTLEKMDVLPRQSIIDVQIYEVDLNNDLNYGLRGMLEARTDGNMTTTGMSDDGWLSFETFANVGDARQIMLALNALKTKTNVKVLEHPSLLATDGIPSRFMVGSEIPYPAGSVATSVSATTNVQYRNTGIFLNVLPRISASGMVTLEITQEVSSVGASINLGDASAPTFSKTNVETILSVRDGETVAIAGLIRDQNRWGRAGVPLLSDIPLIGGLFGGTSRNNMRTELIILITPHVIKTPEKFQEMTQTLRDSLRNVRKFADEKEADHINDMQDARRAREKQELSNIQKVKPPKKEKEKK